MKPAVSPITRVIAKLVIVSLERGLDRHTPVRAHMRSFCGNASGALSLLRVLGDASTDYHISAKITGPWGTSEALGFMLIFSWFSTKPSPSGFRTLKSVAIPVCVYKERGYLSTIGYAYGSWREEIHASSICGTLGS